MEIDINAQGIFDKGFLSEVLKGRKIEISNYKVETKFYGANTTDIKNIYDPTCDKAYSITIIFEGKEKGDTMDMTVKREITLELRVMGNGRRGELSLDEKLYVLRILISNLYHNTPKPGITTEKKFKELFKGIDEIKVGKPHREEKTYKYVDDSPVAQYTASEYKVAAKYGYTPPKGPSAGMKYTSS